MSKNNGTKKQTKKIEEQPFEIFKKVWFLLPIIRKREAIRLWVMMVLGMALEMCSVGLVVPLIGLLTQGGSSMKVPFIGSLSSQFNTLDPKILIASGMVVLVCVYLLKNLFLAFLAWKQSHFIFGLQSDLSQKLFKIYLRQPYSFHLQRNSAHLIRNIQTELNLLINYAVGPYIQLLAEGLIIVGLSVLLVYVEPIGTLIVFSVIFVVTSLYHRYSKKHILQWGEQRILHENLRAKQLHQGLDGAKDVKLFGREKDFLDQYGEHTNQSMDVNRKQHTLLQMPRLWLEFLAVVGLSVLTGAMLAQGKVMIEMLPTIALFAAVSFRLMPSANRIINAIQQLRFGSPAVNLLHKELSLDILDKEINTSVSKKLEKKIELRDVSFAYEEVSNRALDSISIQVNKGDFVGFIGESGSGKSTLVDLVLGLLMPDNGKILKDGININDNLRDWQNQIGYVPQSIYLTDDSLRRNVAFGIASDQIDELAVKRAIKISQLDNFVETLPGGLDTIVGERGVKLSGGQSQRIGIARALYHDPDILVLDEATSSLDNETEQGVMEAVKSLQGEKTILVVAHRLSTVNECHYLYRLEGGRIIDEGLSESVLKKLV